MAFEEYQFLRYFIPGTLYVIYVSLLVIPYLSQKSIDYFVQHPDALLGIIGGAFGASLAFGYIIYTFYDTFLYNVLAMNKSWRRILRDMENRIGKESWSKLSNAQKKEFLDILYIRLGKTDENNAFSSTTRGIWSHFNARMVCSIFVPVFSIVSAATLAFLSMQFFSTSVFLPRFIDIGGFYLAYWQVWLFIVISVSFVLAFGARRPYKEATTLEYFFIRSKVEFDKNIGQVSFENLRDLLTDAKIPKKETSGESMEEKRVNIGPESQKLELDTQKRISNRLVDLIDIVFGVVVAINFAMLFSNSPFESWPALSQVVSLANMSLLVAYIAIILSWVGYHQMIEYNPYRLNRWGYTRFSLDVLIVFMYTVLMYSIKNFTLFLTVFPLIFLLYAVAGAVRNIEYGCKVSWSKGSIWFTIGFSFILSIWLLWEFLLVLAYPVLKDAPISWMLVFVTLLCNLYYRYLRAKKGFIRKN